jgi:hypothetical protein
VKMPMYGSIAEALTAPKRYRWFTGLVLAPYLPWTFSTSWSPSSLPMTTAPTGARAAFSLLATIQDRISPCL